MKAKPVTYLVLLLLILPNASCQGQQSGLDTGERQLASARSFGDTIEMLSGEAGYFDTDNLISNESSYLHVIGQLHDLNIQGGAYLGVGPDQNFSYIAHVRPSIAFIVDIRKDNLLLHLLYKSLFELSDDRVAFLAALFGKELPDPREDAADLAVEEIMQRIDHMPPLDSNRRKMLAARIEIRLRDFGYPLNEEDLRTIHRFHDTFIRLGPDLRFTSHNRSPRPYYPTYRQLAMENDEEGRHASFLASEAHYRYVKQLQEADRVIPVQGNFADPEVIPAIGAYLDEMGEEVTAFYTSNVEYYLMYQRQYPSFLDNVSRLPINDKSVVIRSYFNRYRSSHPLTVPGYASTQLLQRITDMIAHPEATYVDLIFSHSMSR